MENKINFKNISINLGRAIALLGSLYPIQLYFLSARIYILVPLSQFNFIAEFFWMVSIYFILIYILIIVFSKKIMTKKYVYKFLSLIVLNIVFPPVLLIFLRKIIPSIGGADKLSFISSIFLELKEPIFLRGTIIATICYVVSLLFILLGQEKKA